jgi:putative phage-type endonuclease
MTEWHEARRKGLGGSDSPVVLGVSPFRTARELWEEKRTPNLNTEPSAAMMRGTTMEPIIADLYADVTGRSLEIESNLLQDAELPVMQANIDRRIVDENPGVLEIKCPGIHIFNKIKREGAPEYYSVQLQHYLAVTGYNWGSLAIFNAEQWELLFFDVKRDDGLIDLIRVKDAEFWQMVIDGNPPPEEEINLDLPKIGGANFEKLASKQWAEAVERLRQAQGLKKAAEALEKDAKADIVGIMGAVGADIIEGGGKQDLLQRITRPGID